MLGIFPFYSFNWNFTLIYSGFSCWISAFEVVYDNVWYVSESYCFTDTSSNLDSLLSSSDLSCSYSTFSSSSLLFSFICLIFFFSTFFSLVLFYRYFFFFIFVFFWSFFLLWYLTNSCLSLAFLLFCLNFFNSGDLLNDVVFSTLEILFGLNNYFCWKDFDNNFYYFLYLLFWFFSNLFLIISTPLFFLLIFGNFCFLVYFFK